MPMHYADHLLRRSHLTRMKKIVSLSVLFSSYVEIVPSRRKDSGHTLSALV